MIRRTSDTAPLIPISNPGDLLLEQAGGASEVLAVSSDGVLVAQRPAARHGLRLRYRFASGEVTRDLQVRAMEERSTDFGKAFFLRTARDPRVPRLAEFANRGLRSTTGFIRAANDVGANRRGPVAAKRFSVGRFAGAAVGLALAGALFLGSAYMRYGVATFSGSIEAKRVELLRAERAGVFFPYTPGGNHVLKVGELVGVIDSGGRSHSITASCACFLGDFPVSAGSTLYKGAVVARLIPPDSPIEVVARLPLTAEWQVAVGDPVRMEVEGRRVTGRVQAIETDRSAALAADNSTPSEGLAILHIATDEAIDSALFGSEITVHVLRAEALAARAWNFVTAKAPAWMVLG